MIGDLFERSNYPHRAGFKDDTTSKDAADFIEESGKAQVLRELCLALLVRASTPKEVAEMLCEEITSVRPRLTELLIKGLIVRTGERRDRQHVLVKR